MVIYCFEWFISVSHALCAVTLCMHACAWTVIAKSVAVGCTTIAYNFTLSIHHICAGHFLLVQRGNVTKLNDECIDSYSILVATITTCVVLAVVGLVDFNSSAL